MLPSLCHFATDLVVLVVDRATDPVVRGVAAQGHAVEAVGEFLAAGDVRSNQVSDYDVVGCADPRDQDPGFQVA